MRKMLVNWEPSGVSNPLAGSNADRNPDNDEQGNDRHWSLVSEPTLAVSRGKHLPQPSHCFARFEGVASLNRWTDGQSTPVFLIPHLGDVLFSQDGDGDFSHVTHTPSLKTVPYIGGEDDPARGPRAKVI